MVPLVPHILKQNLVLKCWYKPEVLNLILLLLHVTCVAMPFSSGAYNSSGLHPRGPRIKMSCLLPDAEFLMLILTNLNWQDIMFINKSQSITCLSVLLYLVKKITWHAHQHNEITVSIELSMWKIRVCISPTTTLIWKGSITPSLQGLKLHLYRAHLEIKISLLQLKFLCW